MTRDGMAQHMTETHRLHRESFQDIPLEDMLLMHETDHQSVISVEKGLADHRHSEYLEVDGIPAFVL
jgi:hypothetical protein